MTSCLSGDTDALSQSRASTENNLSSTEKQSEQTPRTPSSLVLLCLSCILFIPYCIIPFVLLVLALLEQLIRLCSTAGPRSFGDLAFVKAERKCRMLIASWIMGVPIAKLCESIRAFFLPSLIIQESEALREYVSRGEQLTQEIEVEIADCKELIIVAREQRRIHMQKFREHIDSDQLYNTAYMQLCCSSISDTERLRRHLEVLEKDLINVTLIAKTQAAADRTGYHGLVDWAQKTLDRHAHLIQALSQVSFVGAGLTYSTIFSASRGNIGLMCYAFALFNCGFIVPTVTLALLKWASLRSPEAHFACPHIWSMFLSVAVYLSVIAVVAAICLLNVTIIYLHFDSLQFNVAPRPAGYFALICAAITGLFTFCALILHYMVNGWNTLFSALTGRQKESPGQCFNAYVPK